MVVTAYRMSAAEAEHSDSFSGGLSKDLLLCFICSEYYKDPRVLPCQHTFCRSCLQHYYSLKQAESTTKLNAIPCPRCHAITQVPRVGVTAFPLDTKLRHMKEVYLNVLKKSASEQSEPGPRTDRESRNSPDTNKADDMPFSFQDKENYRNGKFSPSYLPRTTAEQPRPASWYGQSTSTPTARPSPRSSMYGAPPSSKPEEIFTPSFSENSRNPFDRSSRFSARRRRKMERTFDTPDEKVGFKARDRLEEIINNVREEGSQAKNPRGKVYGSEETINGRYTGSPLFGATEGRRGQPPTRSHSFNTHRPCGPTVTTSTTPDGSEERQYTRPSRSSSFNTRANAPATDERPSYFSPEARSREGHKSPRSHASAFTKPSPDPPKFKPKPPPSRQENTSYTQVYTPYKQETQYRPPSPIRSPGLRRSETEPPLSTFFGRNDEPLPTQCHRFEADAHMPQDIDITPPEEKNTEQEPVDSASAKIGETARELHERLNAYCKNKTPTKTKRQMKYDIPDLNDLLSSSDSSDGEDDAAGDESNKTEMTSNGRTSPIRNGHDVTGATIETMHNKADRKSVLTSDTFSTVNIGPDSEEAFAEVGEVEIELSTIEDEPKTVDEVDSDYDNSSDYDNLEPEPDILLKIIESGDETDNGAIKTEMVAETEPEVQKKVEVEVEEVLVEEEQTETVSSPIPSHPDQLNFTPYVPSLLWKLEKDEYNMPTSIAFTSKRQLVVSQYSSGKIEYYDEAGELQYKVDGIKPFAITVNKSDHVIVGDRKSKSIRVFDEFGCDVTQWEENMFKWISGISTTGDGNFVTFDREFCKIRISSPAGERIREFGTYGEKDTQFSQVDFLTVDSHDRIIICDSGNHCVKLFDTSGKFLERFGTRGHGNGEMEWPKGVCVDSNDNIIITDSRNKRATVYSPNGIFLQHILSDCVGIYNVAACSPGMLGITQYSLSGKSQVSVYKL